MNVRTVCVAAWSLACVLEFYYIFTAGIPHQVLLGNIDVTHSVRVGQAQGIIWHLIGLASAILAFKFRSNWGSAILLISSLTYLIVWYFHGSIRRLGIVNGYRMHWYGASLLHYEVSFFIRDVILPITFIVVSALALRDCLHGIGRHEKI